MSSKKMSEIKEKFYAFVLYGQIEIKGSCKNSYSFESGFDLNKLVRNSKSSGKW